jgi:hypothetical protein
MNEYTVRYDDTVYGRLMLLLVEITIDAKLGDKTMEPLDIWKAEAVRTMQSIHTKNSTCNKILGSSGSPK